MTFCPTSYSSPDSKFMLRDGSSRPVQLDMDNVGNRSDGQMAGWANVGLGLCYAAYAIASRTSFVRFDFGAGAWWLRVAPVDLAAAVTLVAFGLRRISYARSFDGASRPVSAGEFGAIAGFTVGCAVALVWYWRSPISTLIFAWIGFAPLGLVVGAVGCGWGSRLWSEFHRSPGAQEGQATLAPSH